MDPNHGFLALVFLVVVTSGARRSESARVITIVNNCQTTIWPAVTPGDSFGGGGFVLNPHQSAIFKLTTAWSGRIWARTGCDFDQAGNGSCQTGRCGSSLQCGSASGEPPATLAEFTLPVDSGLDFYDVSLVDGFNLPVAVTPMNSRSGNCSRGGCDGDLLPKCPPELVLTAAGDRDRTVVGCQSACNVFDRDEYCCRGMFGNPSTCKPTNYSRLFKESCPVAYSYAYDDPSSILTCAGADYIVAFCSNRTQTVCTYHDKKLFCGESNGTKLLSHGWFAVLLFYLISWMSLL